MNGSIMYNVLLWIIGTPRYNFHGTNVSIIIIKLHEM